MKLKKFVFLAMVIIVTGSFTFPTGAFACWATGNYQIECCFVCCETNNDCANYTNPEGGNYNCRFNWYCLFNPVYCRETCPSDPCAFSAALNDDETKIDVLRRFRDEILSQTPLGREYIRLYYEWSPVIVKAMEADEDFKQEVKELIDEMLPMIKEVVE